MSTSSNTFRTHPLDVSYLVIGLVFLGLAGSWALREIGVIDFAEIRWLFPLTLVVAGAVGIVAMAAKGLSRRPDDSDRIRPYVTPDDDTHDTREGETR